MWVRLHKKFKTNLDLKSGNNDPHLLYEARNLFQDFTKHQCFSHSHISVHSLQVLVKDQHFKREYHFPMAWGQSQREKGRLQRVQKTIAQRKLPVAKPSLTRRYLGLFSKWGANRNVSKPFSCGWIIIGLNRLGHSARWSPTRMWSPVVQIKSVQSKPIHTWITWGYPHLNHLGLSTPESPGAIHIIGESQGEGKQEHVVIWQGRSWGRACFGWTPCKTGRSAPILGWWRCILRDVS